MKDISKYNIRILDSSVLTDKNPYDVKGMTIYLHGDIYRNLGSVINNIGIELEPRPNTIFDNFMRDMNSLYDDTQEYQPSEQDKIKLAIIDEYLGSLGISNEYPKDRQVGNIRSGLRYSGYESPFDENIK